jgi:hypothetical protein
METIQTFVLGAISALGILCLGYAFIQAFKINKTVSAIKADLDCLNRELGETHRSIDERFKEHNDHLHQRIDAVLNDLERTIKELYQRIDELNSYVDSRFDKQATKSADIISTGYSNLYEKTEKLEELFKLQMDQFAKVTLNHSERLVDLETHKKREEDQIDQINS